MIDRDFLTGEGIYNHTMPHAVRVLPKIWFKGRITLRRWWTITLNNTNKKMCSNFIGATWRRGPTFYWEVQEPLQRTIINFLNLCDSFSFSFMISKVIKLIFSNLNLTHFEMFRFIMEPWKSECIYSYMYFTASTSLPVLSQFQILNKHLPSLKIVEDLAKFVSFVERNLLFKIFSNTLQLFALRNPSCASQALGCMSLCLKN